MAIVAVPCVAPDIPRRLVVAEPKRSRSETRRLDNSALPQIQLIATVTICPVADRSQLPQTVPVPHDFRPGV